jgi:hypothetical protein
VGWLGSDVRPAAALQLGTNRFQWVIKPWIVVWTMNLVMGDKGKTLVQQR